MKNKFILILSLIVSLFLSLIFFINIDLLNSTIDDNKIFNDISSINIMNTNYINLRDNAPAEFFIKNYKEKKESLKKNFKEENITARLKYKAILISDLGEEEIILNGIETNSDNSVFNIIDDSYLIDNSIIINSVIAKNLNIKENDTVILKLITKDGHYNAEEYNVSAISDKLNYNQVLMDINNLNDFSKLKDYASEIYIKTKNIPKNINDSKIKEIFGEEFACYVFSNNINKIENINYKLCSIIIYFFILFSIFMFINSYYNLNLLYTSIFLIAGYIIAFIIYFIAIKKVNVSFERIYIIAFILNIFSFFLVKIKFLIINKIFLNRVKLINLLSLFSIVIIYSFSFIIVYNSFIYISNNNKQTKKMNTYKIMKENTTENTFLLNGSISNINALKKAIDTVNVKRVISFPVGVVIKTSSVQSRVYAYSSNLDMQKYIIKGKIYETNKAEIIVGKYLANYLNLKVDDYVSLIAKNSRGWLDTMYFKVSGIYDIEKKNYDIYANIDTMYNFLHLRGGNKEPYNESLLIESQKNIYLYLNKILRDNNIDASVFVVNDNYDNIVFIICFLISISLLTSSILYMLNLLSNSKKEVIRKYISVFIFSIVLGLIIILILFNIVFKFVLFTLCVILLSFIISIVSSNLKNNNNLG